MTVKMASNVSVLNRLTLNGRQIILIRFCSSKINCNGTKISSISCETGQRHFPKISRQFLLKHEDLNLRLMAQPGFCSRDTKGASNSPSRGATIKNNTTSCSTRHNFHQKQPHYELNVNTSKGARKIFPLKWIDLINSRVTTWRTPSESKNINVNQRTTDKCWSILGNSFLMPSSVAGAVQCRFCSSTSKGASNSASGGAKIKINTTSYPTISNFHQRQSHYDRNFITAVRAMKDFLLKPEDLINLRVTTRRSPSESKNINVYWRKDVEARSVQIWGTLENLEKEKQKRETFQTDQREQFQSIFRKMLTGRNKKNKLSRENWPVRSKQERSGGDSGRVVMWAIAINGANFLGKLVAWLFTGSHAMFSEAIHSAADTANQMILAYGIKKSEANPTDTHPYGYSNMQYVSSLISGVGIFCVGSGLSIYHGVVGLIHPHDIESVSLAFAVLGVSLLSESVTLALAIRSIRESAAQQDMSAAEYVWGGYDPCVNVVLLEDAAAVAGVVIAGAAMAASVYCHTHIPDAMGSIVIGGLLGSVASFMIYTNSAALVGRSIPEEKLALINKELEGDIMVRQVHDVKGIDMGNGIIRYKAEVDVDGRELAKYYLSTVDSKLLLDEARSMESVEDFELFMLKHGENMVDCLGEQVDRIEKNLKTTHPEVKHVDLEVL